MIDIYIPSGRFRDGELPEAAVGVEGWITLRAKSRFGTIRRERQFKLGHPSFHNLILNSGLDFLAMTGPQWSHFRVGVGTTPPDPTDTQLGNDVGSLSSLGSGQGGRVGSPDYYCWRRSTYQNAIGALGNVILTECGVYGSGSGGRLFSRELIRDSSGDPTSFPISDDEQLQAIYEVRMYAPTADANFTANIGPDPYDATVRALDVNGSAWNLPSQTTNTTPFASGNINQQSLYAGGMVSMETPAPGSLIADATEGGTSEYVPGSYERTISATWPSGTSGNVNTVRRRFSSCMFQVGLEPSFPKTSEISLTLHQKVSWGRR